MSVPLDSVQTINVSDRVIQLAQVSFLSSVKQPGGYSGTETLLFLIAIVLGDLGLEQDAIRFVFGFDIYSRYLLFRQKKSTEIWLAQLPKSQECRVADSRICG
jgi:hypothetical protein